MKLCSPSNGCEPRPVKGDPPTPGASLAASAVTKTPMRRHASEWAVGFTATKERSFWVPRALCSLKAMAVSTRWASRGIVKLRLTAAFGAQYGGFATDWSPVSWGSLDELFVNLTMPTCLPHPTRPPRPKKCGGESVNRARTATPLYQTCYLIQSSRAPTLLPTSDRTAGGDCQIGWGGLDPVRYSIGRASWYFGGSRRPGRWQMGARHRGRFFGRASDESTHGCAVFVAWIR